ncbi:hypothetical protein [Rhodococcus sp. KRD197]|uniref:hypothetical protein n=1 Tax=Rhodococcus sp. KRD197 TaxID=2729731 RepID=UPI0019CFFAD8|nr:hypothetical protein [Rhodococcus sp. KRD197]
MADLHQTRERSAWVLARAGRNPAARRRGERLASRSRRSTRYEAGVGDAAVGEVVTPNRVHRAVYKGEDHRILRVLWLALRESVQALAAGPGIAAAWGLYGLWWRNTASWGPMRWKPVAAVSLGALPVLLVLVGAVIWMHNDVPFLAWYATVQLVIAVARLAWLIRAYGWEAVTSGARPNQGHTVTRISGLPDPAPNRVVVRRRVAPPTPPPTIIARTIEHEDSDQ